MLASFLIPFHSRRIDNLAQTLRFLELHDREVLDQSEVILLCHDQIGYIETGFQKTHLENMHLPNMMKPVQLNHGVKMAQSDILVVLDSDRILPPGYFQKVLGSIEEDDMVTTRFMRKLTRPAADIDIIEEKYSFYDEERSISNRAYSRSAFSGNIVLYKKQYEKAGGMDESYVGYGFEDADMTARLTSVGVRPHYRPELELHLYHEECSYGDHDQKRMFLDNGLRFCRKWKVPYPQNLRKKSAST